MCVFPGTVVICTSRVDDYWFRGSTLDGEEGTFPPSYCWEPDPSNYVSALKAEKHRVEKYAQVLHSMSAQLEGEIDLVEGDIVKIVEIIDKDWYRGEANGVLGVFPASFVRVVDAFPGDAPPASANLKPYLDAPKHKKNEYMNTKNSLKGLEEGLRSIGQQAVIKSVINGIPETVQSDRSDLSRPPQPARDASIPEELFQDDYFRKNLPQSYGSVSTEPPPSDAEYNPEQSMFGSEVRKCSMGFQEMSRNLSALGNAGKGRGYFPYYSQPTAESSASSVAGYSRSATIEYSSSSISMIRDEQSTPRPSEDETLPRSSEQEDFSLTPKVDYNKISEGLSGAFKQSKSLDSDTMPTMTDYSKLSKNLSVFSGTASSSRDDDNGDQHLSATERMLKLENSNKNPSSSRDFQSHSAISAAIISKNQNNNNVVASKNGDGYGHGNDSSLSSIPEREQEVTRYQNVKSSTLGYTGATVDVRPYAIAKFNFVAEFESEVGFSAGEMVYLARYVDNEWLEGEIDGNRGMFPISYVNVIVDCGGGSGSRSTAVTVHENLLPETYHRVLYNFSAQMNGDITVAEGEVVLIVESRNDGDWMLVENSQGERGVMPGNHLDSRAEFEGKEQFDIERLLNYANKKMEEKKQNDSLDPLHTATKSELKYFDPLSSPSGDGEEMSRIEQELEKKAKDPTILRRIQQPQQSMQYPYKRVPPPPPDSGSRTPKLVPKPPRDIDTLICNNLSRLRNLETPTSTSPLAANSPNAGKRISISQLVLEEMRGKNPEPVRPASGAKFDLDLAKEIDDMIREQHAKKKPRAEHPSPAQSPRPRAKRAAPPIPPGPKLRSVKSPAPPRPPDPKAKPIKDLEPIYSQINKEARRFSVTGAGGERKAAPPRPSRPPLLPALSLPTTSNPPPHHVDRIEVKADIHIHQTTKVHPYDTPENDESGGGGGGGGAGSMGGDAMATPTNEVISCTAKVDDLPPASEEDELSNRSDPIYSSSKNSDSSVRAQASDSVYASYPAIPERTSSILRREQELYQEQIRQEQFGPPSFPPDRKSPMSPPPAGQEQPPKVASLPSCRSASVASSVKSRSAFYASV